MIKLIRSGFTTAIMVTYNLISLFSLHFTTVNVTALSITSAQLQNPKKYLSHLKGVISPERCVVYARKIIMVVSLWSSFLKRTISKTNTDTPYVRRSSFHKTKPTRWVNLLVIILLLNSYGQRCFAVSGPTLWNTLPLSVRDPSLTLTQFCKRLKTVLFCRAYETLA